MLLVVEDKEGNYEEEIRERENIDHLALLD
jgi:hypothetical protein